MESFAKIANDLKPLTTFEKKLHLRYLNTPLDSCIQIGVLGHFAPCGIFGFGGIRIF